MHERWPAPSDMLRNTTAVHVWDDWSVAKPREECQRLTFEFHSTDGSEPLAGGCRRGYRQEQNVKCQEKFVKGLAALEKKIAREHKARAKALKAAA